MQNLIAKAFFHGGFCTFDLEIAAPAILLGSDNKETIIAYLRYFIKNEL